MWEIEIRHEGLNKYRKIRGSDQAVVEEKAFMQQREWEDIWSKKLAREKATKNVEESKNMALGLTQEAEAAILAIEKTLIAYLEGGPFILDWNKLKDKGKFTIAKPTKATPKTNSKKTIPRMPLETDEIYKPKIGFWDSLFAKARQEKINEARSRFERDFKFWVESKASIEKYNQDELSRYRGQLALASSEHEIKLKQWEEEKQKFFAAQEYFNSKIDNRKKEYEQGTEEGIKDLISLVISSSKYPAYFPQEYTLEYNAETHMLVVEYILPVPENLPNLKDVKYIQTKNEFKETYLSEGSTSKLYDDLLYKMTLRTIREILDADIKKHIHAIVFNGWVNSTDKATGKEYSACILSIQTERDEFMDINLSQVDPKVCFKKLKGIGSSKLFSLTPVAPILKINRNDSRFVSSYDVAEYLDDSVNLAAMDWQDFEHLIRELFEKEFNTTGGEVKITRASKDGGVDAVAFDPDPIRGGKIVVQAKRYTNTVGLSAVRDLYGTVLNEGANKGILVSTADYGPDAYSFAKDKPITLLDGGNLLHLLQKHGHRARIDLKEAKIVLAEQK